MRIKMHPVTTQWHWKVSQKTQYLQCMGWRKTYSLGRLRGKIRNSRSKIPTSAKWIYGTVSGGVVVECGPVGAYGKQRWSMRHV